MLKIQKILGKFKAGFATIKLINLALWKIKKLGFEGLLWYSIHPIIDGELWYKKAENLEILESKYFSAVGKNKPNRSLAAQINKLWHKAEILEFTGAFQQAQRIKKEILHTTWEKHNLQVGKFVPPFIDSFWLEAFGHQGFLGVFSLAQSLNIIHPERRTIIDLGHANLKRPVMSEILKDFNLWQNNSNASILNHPNLFCLSEKITMVASPQGFLHISEVTEKTLTLARDISLDIKFSLSEEHKDAARSYLCKLGLPRDAWFVGLHVREGWRMKERNADINTYLEAIKFITSQGGWVVRIGDSSMTPLHGVKNVIELFQATDEYLVMQDFVMTNCKFFIGTTSGPQIFPPIFGVPLLSANIVAVAKNNFSCQAPSIAIPKVWVEMTSNRELSIEESLELGLGFVEISNAQQGKYRTRNNTSDEILSATKEIYSLSNQKDMVMSTRQNSLLVLRKEIGAITYGPFAESFLQNN